MREIIQAAGQKAAQMAGQTAGLAVGLGAELGQAGGQASDQVVQSERKRVEAVVETLATLRSEGESLAELAHDARNMVTALGLYCDLLEEPGVLATAFAHYGSELRLVAAASRSLVEKLVALDVRGNGVRNVALRESTGLRGSGVRNAGVRNAGLGSAGLGRVGRAIAAPVIDGRDGGIAGEAATLEAAFIFDAAIVAAPETARGTTAIGQTTAFNLAGRWDLMPPEQISNLAQELLASRNLLSALAGSTIAVSVDAEGCDMQGGALPVRLNSEDLTRVLVNLVKNAAEAMPGGGSVRIGLSQRSGAGVGATSAEPNPDPNPDLSASSNVGSEATGSGQTLSRLLSLTIEDNGPGIPRKTLERIFEAGFTTRATETAAEGLPIGGWHSAHRGLGLSITRSIVEAAGGRIYATNREGSGTPGRGACFEIVLPVRSR
jgi:signal transduction histidine kinase